MTAVCTCCGETFETDVPQEIGEEMCNECYKVIFIDPIVEEDDGTPLIFEQGIYDLDKYTTNYEDLEGAFTEGD